MTPTPRSGIFFSFFLQLHDLQSPATNKRVNVPRSLDVVPPSNFALSFKKETWKYSGINYKWPVWNWFQGIGKSIAAAWVLGGIGRNWYLPYFWTPVCPSCPDDSSRLSLPHMYDMEVSVHWEALDRLDLFAGHQHSISVLKESEIFYIIILPIHMNVEYEYKQKIGQLHTGPSKWSTSNFIWFDKPSNLSLSCLTSSLVAYDLLVLTGVFDDVSVESPSMEGRGEGV